MAKIICKLCCKFYELCKYCKYCKNTKEDVLPKFSILENENYLHEENINLIISPKNTTKYRMDLPNIFLFYCL